MENTCGGVDRDCLQACASRFVGSVSVKFLCKHCAEYSAEYTMKIVGENTIQTVYSE